VILFVIISFVTSPPYLSIGFTSWNIDTFIGNFWPDWRYHFVNYQGLILLTQQECFPLITQVFINIKKVGILFPSCSGIMGGANISGDLSSPQTQIPNGTILALIITFSTYILICFLLSFTVKKEALVTNSGIMASVSYFSPIVTLGIFSVTLSSGLTSIIGSAKSKVFNLTKVLQALSKDRLLPFLNFFEVGSGANNEPRRAVVLTWFLVQFMLLLGEINIIAPIVGTIFLYLSFAILNFACFSLSITGV
jgi:amino acid transporter